MCFLIIVLLIGKHVPLLSLSLLTPYQDVLRALYYVVSAVGIFLTTLLSFRSSTDPRKQQQFRLLAGGIVLSLLPVLLLAILPSVISNITIDGSISAQALIFLPLAFGYAILRYQILLLDSYLQRIVSLVVAGVALLLFGCCALIFFHLVLGLQTETRIILLTLTMVLSSPIIWQASRRLSDRVFFSEAHHYRTLLEEPAHLSATGEQIDLDTASTLLVQAAIRAFQTPMACLFVANESRQRYCLTPPPALDTSTDSARSHVAQNFLRLLSLPQAPLEVESAHALISRLTSSPRPLFTQDLLSSESKRAFASPLLTEDGGTFLIAAVPGSNGLIGILVLQRSGSHFSGPDLDTVKLLLRQYGQRLEIAYVTRALSERNAQLTDVSRALSERNAQLTVAYERQKELDALKDQFMMTTAHELRTPVTAVQGYLELLKGYNDYLPSEERLSCLEKASLGCEELVYILDNTMDGSRVEIDAKNMHLIPVALASVVERVSDVMSGTTQKEERQLLIDVPPSLWVRADEFRTRQVLLNLISNAYKYSPGGSNVEITADGDETMVRLRVRDYGAGVPQQHQAELFERFVRLERDMNSPVRGAGLGLYICKQLIEAMGGRIWVESSGIPGEGSVFAFHLPRLFEGVQAEPGITLEGSTVQ
jgi:signal transduction histidine kinase